MKISPARTAAFDVLLKIEREHAYSSILLPAHESELSDRDKGLCHEIVLGVLRRKLYLDAVTELFSKGKKLDLEVLIALRIGLYQLYFLQKIPDHSAVTESVNLVQRAKKTSAKGFVNALLRRATRETPEIGYSDEIERISIETSHPRWLLERWIEQFGREEGISIATANNEIPKPAFRLTAKGKRNNTMLPEGTAASSFIDGCFLLERMQDELKGMADRGEIYFQDEGSQMVGSAIEIPNDGSFLDLCAAPGSKTSMIAEKFSPISNLIVAGDFHEKRAGFLRENCLNQGLDHVFILRYDAENELPFADGCFDVVLADVPCSGTGTIRSNPEIRYFLQPADFSELQNKQLAILKNASKVLKSGGSLIYSTCSLDRDENEEVIGAFLEAVPNFRLRPSNVPDLFVRGDLAARTFPHRDMMDGFFIATLTKD
jgi:16S rRNA (cytosine967-C5)-methyltransferase